MRNQGSTCNECNGGYFCPLGASEEIKCNKIRFSFDSRIFLHLKTYIAGVSLDE